MESSYSTTTTTTTATTTYWIWKKHVIRAAMSAQTIPEEKTKKQRANPMDQRITLIRKLHAYEFRHLPNHL